MRLTAAALLPSALVQALAAPAGNPVPLVLFAVAAATDFADGIVARRAGETRHGAILDNAADVAFVLAGTATAAWTAHVPWAVPLAIASAVGAYAAASVLRSRRRRFGLARSRVGHAAGVANYALVAGVVLAAALPAAAWGPVLRGASVVVVAVNVAAALGHVVARARGDDG